MVTEHPTSRAPVRGTRTPTLPHTIVRSLPRHDRERCLSCGSQLWSGNGDGLQLCWSCRQRVNSEVGACELHEFRLVLMVRLMCTFGEDVDVAHFFGTTDRRRIWAAVQWWRKKGARIVATPKGEYRIIGWAE